ncbi:unnamed protein product, partial [Rhizoctonia solani]
MVQAIQLRKERRHTGQRQQASKYVDQGTQSSFYSLRSHGSVSSFGASSFKEYIDSFSASSDSSSRYSSSSSLGSSPHSHSPEVAGIKNPAFSLTHDDRQSHTDSEGEQQSSTLANLLPLIPQPSSRQLAKTIWLPLQRLDSLAPGVQLKFDWSSVFEKFIRLDQSPHQLYARHLDRWPIYPRLPSVHTRLCRQLAKFESSLKNCWAELVSDILESIGSGTHGCAYGVSLGLWHEDDDISGQLERTVDRLIELQGNYGRESWVDIVSGCLEELFMVLEDLQLAHDLWPSPSYRSIRGSHPYSYTSAWDAEAYNKELACQTWVTQVLTVFDLEFERLDTALRRQIADTWGRSLKPSLEERTGSFKKRVKIMMTDI